MDLGTDLGISARPAGHGEDQCFADDGFVTGRLAPHASSSAATGNARSARMAIQLRLMMTTMKWICRSHVSGSPDSACESPANMSDHEVVR